MTMMDISLGKGMDGLATFKKILEFRPSQKALIVTGFSNSKRIKQALSLGAGGYVKKPYLADVLAMAVRKALDREVK